MLRKKSKIRDRLQTKSFVSRNNFEKLIKEKSIFFLFWLDATNVTGELLYCFKWAQGYKFYNAEESVQNWPALVFNFLENNLIFD